MSRRRRKHKTNILLSDVNADYPADIYHPLMQFASKDGINIKFFLFYRNCFYKHFKSGRKSGIIYSELFSRVENRVSPPYKTNRGNVL